MFMEDCAQNYVSVVIPTFNGFQKLALLLRSLEKQTVQRFEVIVVDDGSDDETQQNVSCLQDHYPVPLRYFYLDNTSIFGAAIARNFGAKQAKGSILLFIDQDFVAANDLVEKHSFYHRHNDIILGYCAGYGEGSQSYRWEDLDRFIRTGRHLPIIKEFRHSLFYQLHDKHDLWRCFVSAHFSIKKILFMHYKFDETFIQWGGQDVDLGYRLFKQGYRAQFMRDCIVYNSCSTPQHTKKKVRELITSLLYTYKKHCAQEIIDYGLDRFYHVPFKYRANWQLCWRLGQLEAVQRDIYILFTKQNYLYIFIIGKDFQEMKMTLLQLIQLSEGVILDYRRAPRDLREHIKFKKFCRQIHLFCQKLNKFFLERH